MTITRREAIKQIGALAAVISLPACSTVNRRERPLEPPPPESLAPARQQTIALLGATGMSGGYILNEALRQGYRVRALARTPAKLQAYHDLIEVIEGDALDPAVLAELLRGSDVLISALGPVKSDGHAAINICSRVTGLVIDVMQSMGLARYILVSGAGVEVRGDHRDGRGWLIRKLAQLTLTAELHDKQMEYGLLQASMLDWTLMRCPIIDPLPYHNGAEATLDTPVSFHVGAGDLARFAVEQVASQDFVRKAPFLGNR